MTLDTRSWPAYALYRIKATHSNKRPVKYSVLTERCCVQFPYNILTSFAVELTRSPPCHRSVGLTTYFQADWIEVVSMPSFEAYLLPTWPPRLQYSKLAPTTWPCSHEPCSTGDPYQYKDHLSRCSNPIIQIRRSHDRLIFTMGIHTGASHPSS